MVALLENPLRVGLQQDRIPEPQILVIFGASGDLTQRKLVPAIYQMKLERRLPPELTIVGVARRDWSNDFFREHLREGVKEFGGGLRAEEIWQDFARGLFTFREILTILRAMKTSRSCWQVWMRNGVPGETGYFICQ